MDISVTQILHDAGQSPVWQGVAIILGTFILEDAATAATAIEVQAGHVALPVGLIALYMGIVLGDIGLYGLGFLAARVPWAMKLIPQPRADRGRAWLEKYVFRVVFISRFIPGARLPTYTACGFLAADFRKFTLAAIGATLIWTSGLFAVSLHVGRFLIDHFGAWRWVGALGFIVVILAAGRMAMRVQERAP